jgi:hypothetical protein
MDLANNNDARTLFERILRENNQPGDFISRVMRTVKSNNKLSFTDLNHVNTALKSDKGITIMNNA